MTSDLHSLAYFSRNAIEASGAELNVEIERILATARANNSRLHVTGALLFSGTCFAQVLEGPLEAVESLFEQIECDPRHCNVTILHFKPTDRRSFGDWSMAYAGHVASAADHLNLEGLFDHPDAIESEQAGRDVVRVLGDLIQRTEAAHA